MTNSPQNNKKLTDSSKDLFDSWRESTALKKGDQFPERVKKILFRLLGIVLIIVFSPIILLILLFALLAAV